MSRCRQFLCALTALLTAGALLVAVPAVSGATDMSVPNLSGSEISVRLVASGLGSLTTIVWRHNDARMYVAEKTGAVRIVNPDGTVVPTPVVTESVLSTGEQGLIGMTFSPDGTELYVDYVGNPDGDIHVVAYAMNGDVADTSTARTILDIPHPLPVHYSGNLVFGPDGYLYISVGDGGPQGDPDGHAQNLGLMLGKILRINPTPTGPNPYTVPADNPFVGHSGALPEIWMYGLRNAWRYSFDTTTHEMYIADVGYNSYEEIDVAQPGQKGTDWGWPTYEGFSLRAGEPAVPNATPPLLAVSHSNGSCAIIGGFVYHGRAIPNLDGVYLYGDLCRSVLVGVTQTNGKLTGQQDMVASIANLTSFGQDQNGEIFATTTDGKIYKIEPGSTLPGGYYQSGANGQVFSSHSPRACAAAPASASNPVVGIAASTLGYWTATANGNVNACRVASLGSVSTHLNAPIVGIASTPDSGGYWLVASDGGVFSFGDARFHGSEGGVRLNKPIVGIERTASGNGYWLVASDGGVFTFGDAKFHGSTGALRLNKPIIGMATDVASDGYWLVASDGGSFTFGNVHYYGSLGSTAIPAPITGVAPSPTGKGYWLSGADGSVYGFGDAKNVGSATGHGVAITGISSH